MHQFPNEHALQRSTKDPLSIESERVDGLLPSLIKIVFSFDMRPIMSSRGPFHPEIWGASWFTTGPSTWILQVASFHRPMHSWPLHILVLTLPICHHQSETSPLLKHIHGHMPPCQLKFLDSKNSNDCIFDRVLMVSTLAPVQLSPSSPSGLAIPYGYRWPISLRDFQNWELLIPRFFCLDGLTTVWGHLPPNSKGTAVLFARPFLPSRISVELKGSRLILQQIEMIHYIDVTCAHRWEKKIQLQSSFIRRFDPW